MNEFKKKKNQKHAPFVLHLNISKKATYVRAGGAPAHCGLPPRCRLVKSRRQLRMRMRTGTGSRLPFSDSDRQWPRFLQQAHTTWDGLGTRAQRHARTHAPQGRDTAARGGEMASIFGKIFVGIYVEIKRSDGTVLASFTVRHARTHTHRETGSAALHPAAPDESSLAVPAAGC